MGFAVAEDEAAQSRKVDGTMPSIAEALQGRLLVVYDGECGFCNRSIRWLLRRDRHDRLRFAPSSDPQVQALLLAHGIQNFGPNTDSGKSHPESSQISNPDTVVVLRHIGAPVEEMLVRSNAVLACLRVLPQPWPLFAGMLRLIPRPGRESAYKLIARYRYKLWGRHAICPIPTAEERSHFL